MLTKRALLIRESVLESYSTSSNLSDYQQSAENLNLLKNKNTFSTISKHGTTLIYPLKQTLKNRLFRTFGE